MGCLEVILTLSKNEAGEQISTSTLGLAIWSRRAVGTATGGPTSKDVLVLFCFSLFGLSLREGLYGFQLRSFHQRKDIRVIFPDYVVKVSMAPEKPKKRKEERGCVSKRKRMF